jgi:hypothetical protein
VHRVAEVDFASHINLDADVGARVDIGGNPYIWLGTDKVFNSFTFAFEQTSAGWVWFHAYPSSAGISTLHRGVRPSDLAGTRIRFAEERGQRPATGEDLRAGP